MIRFGVDFGGTKIEVAALNEAGAFVARVRKPNPGNYEEALDVVAGLLADAEAMAGATCARLGERGNAFVGLLCEGKKAEAGALAGELESEREALVNQLAQLLADS